MEAPFADGIFIWLCLFQRVPNGRSIYERIEERKTIMIEPKDKNELARVFLIL
jgi:hypothetical protein